MTHVLPYYKAQCVELINTYKNLVYDLAHHKSPIAQWLERPTGIWKVMGSTPVGGSENYFSEYFDLRMLFIIYTLSKSLIHLSFIHNYHFDIAQWLERPTGIWKVIGSTPVGGSEN